MGGLGNILGQLAGGYQDAAKEHAQKQDDFDGAQRKQTLTLYGELLHRDDISPEQKQNILQNVQAIIAVPQGAQNAKKWQKYANIGAIPPPPPPTTGAPPQPSQLGIPSTAAPAIGGPTLVSPPPPPQAASGNASDSLGGVPNIAGPSGAKRQTAAADAAGLQPTPAISDTVFRASDPGWATRGQVPNYSNGGDDLLQHGVPNPKAITPLQSTPPPPQSIFMSADERARRKEDGQRAARTREVAMMQGVSDEAKANYEATGDKTYLQRDLKPDAESKKPAQFTVDGGKTSFMGYMVPSGKVYDSDGNPMKGAVPFSNKPEPAAEDDRRYRELVKKEKLGQKLTPDEQADKFAYEHQKTLVGNASSTIRVEGMMASREYPVINKQTGQLEMRNAADINRNPGLFAPSGQGSKDQNSLGVFDDIHFNVNQTRQAIDKLNTTFDTATRAQLALALRTSDPRSALGSFINSSAAKTLTPDQIDYVTALASLMENSMALRSVAGMGQGSNELREAILRALPGPTTPSKEYAQRQLKLFEGTLNRLEAPARKRVGSGSEPPPVSNGSIFARDPQGQLHEAPAGTALPASWTLEKR